MSAHARRERIVALAKLGLGTLSRFKSWRDVAELVGEVLLSAGRFVRGKARRNTERFAAERGLNLITVETLYDAKAHYSR